jgi:hypothetical protein
VCALNFVVYLFSFSFFSLSFWIIQILHKKKIKKKKNGVQVTATQTIRKTKVELLVNMKGTIEAKQCLSGII